LFGTAVFLSLWEFCASTTLRQPDRILASEASTDPPHGHPKPTWPLSRVGPFLNLPT